MDLTNLILSLEKIRQYEKEEQDKDINYKIKELPTELTKIIFSYVSITPFEKEDFLNYHRKKMPNYFLHIPRLHQYYCETTLVAFDKKQNPRTDENLRYDMYQARTRFTESIYECNFSRQHKVIKHTTRFMDIFRSWRYLSKASYREIIAENIDPKILKELVGNNKYYSRLNKEELCDIVMKYYLKYN